MFKFIKKQPAPAPVFNPKFFDGFKLIPQTKTDYIKNHIKRKKIIYYNPNFFYKISDFQKWFLLRWAVNNHRLRDQFKSDNKTYLEYLRHGWEPHEVTVLFTDFMRKNKELNKKRLFFMLTTGADRSVLRFWQKVKRFFKWN